MDIKTGIYEQVINQALTNSLSRLSEEEFSILSAKIDLAESKVILAGYMGEVLRASLQLILEISKKDEKLQNQVKACNNIIHMLSELVPGKGIEDYAITPETEQLLAVFEKQMAFVKSELKDKRPESSIAISSLFTGNRNEPQMVSELKKEIASADRIDLLVSFIKWSGLRLIIKDLEEHCESKPLRVITTTYMGATDAKAVVELAKLPNTEVKVSYDTRSSRLHAKAYIFHRDNGFTTAYVGSSNLSSSALSGGLEWNVKVTNKDLPHIIRNVNATFDSYWDDRDFTHYRGEEEEHRKLSTALNRANKECDIPAAFLFDIEPYPFQKEILEELEAERTIHNRFRNLLVAATGTGKTVVSALDYRRFRQQNPHKKNRLLFLAHREEILTQSLNCFRGVLRDLNFGDLYVGRHRPQSLDHLFMSIQTFSSQDFTSEIDPEFYDFIIIDETHHGAAPTYHNALTHFRPKILLGLTATPERMDGSDIKEYYDGVIASEIRLPEAINRNLLVPFQYFCVSDSTDLSKVHFERGRYDVAGLTEAYAQNKERVGAIIRALESYVADIDKLKALGFCASQQHAQFMADFFNEAGIASIALTAKSGQEERDSAQSKLERGEIKIIFTVDLYNEGVDIPFLNTVLFLRPTESLTIFLQQLGRGLRLHPEKEELTVLDFIGQAHQKYSFERKFQSLVEASAKSIEYQVTHGFSALPKGCYIQMERMAQSHILENIKNAIISKPLILNRISSFEDDTGKKLHLGDFLDHNGIALHQIYKSTTFTNLKVQAKVSKEKIDDDLDKIYHRFFRRIIHVDSRRWIRLIKSILEGDKGLLSEDEEKALLMLYYNHPISNNGPPEKQGYRNILDFAEELKTSVYINELLELLNYRHKKIKFIDKEVDLGFHNMLDLHCSYTRDEILAGLGLNTMDHRRPSREGIYYYREENTDLLFINLHKAEKDFSPTTMYEDYAISEDLFHWQTQSTTSVDSPTGKRYISQRPGIGQVLLFVRKTQRNLSGIAAPFTYLGKANYVRHYGDRPVSIIWELEEPMPLQILEASGALR